MPKLFHKTLEEEQFGGLEDSTKPKCHWWNAKDAKKKEHPTCTHLLPPRLTRSPGTAEIFRHAKGLGVPLAGKSSDVAAQ